MLYVHRGTCPHPHSSSWLTVTGGYLFPLPSLEYMRARASFLFVINRRSAPKRCLVCNRCHKWMNEWMNERTDTCKEAWLCFSTEDSIESITSKAKLDHNVPTSRRTLWASFKSPSQRQTFGHPKKASVTIQTFYLLPISCVSCGSAAWHHSETDYKFRISAPPTDLLHRHLHFNEMLRCLVCLPIKIWEAHALDSSGLNPACSLDVPPRPDPWNQSLWGHGLSVTGAFQSSPRHSNVPSIVRQVPPNFTNSV